MSDDSGDPLTVAVTASGELYLDTGDAPELVDEQTLVETVGAIVARNPQLQVVVNGDRDVAYQHIYEAMTFLQRAGVSAIGLVGRSEEHTSELQSRGHLVCRLLLEKKKSTMLTHIIT